MSYGGPCIFCGRTVEAEHAAYPITGFETTRKAGGANRILGRERVPGQIAHVYCAERHVAARRRGLEGQASLL